MKLTSVVPAAALLAALAPSVPSLAGERLASPAKAPAPPLERAMGFVREVCLAPGLTVEDMIRAGVSRGYRFEDAAPPKVEGMEIRRLAGASLESESGAKFSVTFVDAVLPTGRGKVSWRQCNVSFSPGDEAAAAKRVETEFGPSAERPRLGGHGWAFRQKGTRRSPADVAMSEIPNQAAALVAGSPDKGPLVSVSTNSGHDGVDLFVVVFAPLEGQP